MARIIYGMLMSLDGYIAGPDGGMALPVPGSARHQQFHLRLTRTGFIQVGL